MMSHHFGKVLGQIINRKHSPQKEEKSDEIDLREDDDDDGEQYDGDDYKAEEIKINRGWSQVSDFEKGQFIGAYDAGESIHHLSERLGRDRATIRRWIKRWRKEGTIARRQRPGSGRPPALLP